VIFRQKGQHSQINNPRCAIFIHMIYRLFYSLLCLQFWLLGTVLAQTAADGWIIENIHGPSQVGIVETIPVDINGDGFMDVVSASIDDGHLRAYINQGSGQDLVEPLFKEMYISKDVPGIYRVSATDLNNDGVTDFVLPSIETHEIIALIADPTIEPYGYRKKIIAKEILLPTDAQIGDFNNDGLKDVVSISFELNTVYLHLQNNAGAFGTEVISKSIQRPRKILVENFNNDFQTDFLVASSEDHSVRMFENQGEGVFTQQTITDQAIGTRYIAACDADGNDLIDFVVAATTTNTVFLYTNLSDGNFLEQVVDIDLPGVNALHCADIDNDNHDELISIASQIGNIYTQELNGSNKQLIANTRDGYVSVNAAVFETNGPIQILTQAYFESRNLLYQTHQANQEFVVWEDFPDGALVISQGDLDGDYDTDYVYASFNDGKVYWAEQLFDQSYDNHLLSDYIDGPQSISVDDIDADGDLDIVVGGAWDNTFWVFINLGEGLFSQQIINNQALNAARSVFVDISENKWLEVVGTATQADAVFMYKGSESQGFESIAISTTIDGPLALDSADIDADGDQDIAVTSFFGNQIILLVNMGGETFEKLIIEKNIIHSTSIQICDLDQDQDLDLVYLSSNMNAVWWSEQLEDFSFKKHLISDTARSVITLICIDWNQDGVNDLVTSSPEARQIKFYENQGAGEFIETNAPSSYGYNWLIQDFNKVNMSFIGVSHTFSSVSKLMYRDVIYSNGFDLF